MKKMTNSNTFNLCLLTKRLRLRPLLLDDAEFILKMRSDKKTMQFIERPLMSDISEARLLCANILDQCSNQELWFWVIELIETAKVIGTITIWNYRKKDERAELGFMLYQDFTRKGYMKEASEGVTDFAFNVANLNSLEAHTRPENIPSIKILESIGFYQDAFLKENVNFNGRFWDTFVFSKLKKDAKQEI